MNLAVFLPNWIGDAVMATGALRALRSQFQGGKIIGVVKPYVAGVLEGGDWFDELLMAHGGSWSQGVAATAVRLRKAKIDLAILFPNSFRSALTAWLGKCRRRVGYARYGRDLLLTDALEPERNFDGSLRVSPILDAYNRLAEHVGCLQPLRELELYTTPTDERAADYVWDRGGYHAFPEVICLNPGAAFGQAKHWPSEYFSQLALELVSQRGSGVLILAGPSEIILAKQIATMAGHPAVKALPEILANSEWKLSLGLSKACVRRCDLLVTTDSGPRHFGTAFDRPVITLFGPTHIEWTETYHPRALHLQKKVECGPCQRRVCPLDHRCMRLIEPPEVFAAVETLLA